MPLVWVLLAIATLAASPARAQGVASETLVMPFENTLTDPKLFWLAEGSAVLLSETLERYGAITVARESRLSAFERLQLPPAVALSHATVIKIGQFVGASDVVTGAFALSGDRLTVRTRTIRLEAGRLLPEVVEEGPLTDLVGIYDRTARRLRGATSPAPDARSGTLLRSPSALELFVKGLIAEQLPTKRSLLEQAGRSAPDEDRIKIALWHVHTDMGDHVRALDVISKVPTTSIRSRPSRYLSALSMIDLKRYDDAFATLKALNAEARSAEALNAMGVVQLRRGGNPPIGTAAQFFSQASQTDPSDPDYFFNLGYAHWIDKDPPAAIYWLREAVRRAPTDGDAHFVLSAALQQGGATAEAARERELALRLSSNYGGEARSATEPVPRGMERLKEYLERQSPSADSIITSTGQRDQAELAVFHLDAGRRAFDREADREAERELRRALYLSPYLAEANLLLGRLHLRSGRTADAIQAFKIALWSAETAAGHVALAEAYLQSQNLDAAKEEVERALVLEPTSAEARALREKLAKK